MSKRTLLELDGVGFTYSTGIGFYGGRKIDALRDVSFAVEEGETLGLIGRNGCGKSTLLRIMTGIFRPDRGRVLRHCNRISLLTLAMAFDRLLSGSDNLVLSCMLLGASKAEAMAMHDSIVEFAELEEFIDQPVKAYSSGMRARLGFSIGLQMQADLILIDEVLGVGDAHFRRKAEDAMRSRINSEQSVIFVSHHLSNVSELCQRAVWLEDGAVQMQGETARVVEAYREFMENARGVGRPGVQAAGS